MSGTLQLMEPDLDMGLPAKDPDTDTEDAIAVNVDVTNVPVSARSLCTTMPVTVSSVAADDKAVA